MIVKTAEFVISNTDVQKCPINGLPEYAFIGRSNVGKSSLINMLTNRRNLAMTSSKPGKTLLINHFIINNNWYLVDLPGYGFATAGKSTKDKLRKIIDSYILLRDQLTCLFLLIDCRHEPQKIDVDFMNWLGISGVPFAIVFTKADKLTKSELNIRINNYKEKLMETWEEIPPVFITSSDTGMGKEELLGYIEGINNEMNK